MTAPNLSDAAIMRLAIDAAAANPRAPFGAVIVHHGDVIATGVNHSRVDGPLWHGETDCLNNAAAAGFDAWSEATLATTAEPCPMCMSAILWAGLGRVLYGTSVPTLVDRGWNQFTLRAADIIQAAPFTTCDLIGDVSQSDCDALFPCR